MLVLDGGGVTYLAKRTTAALALVEQLRAAGLWAPLVPTVVLVECLQGRAGPDAQTNRLLKACILDVTIPEALARRASLLRRAAGRGSAVDALVVAYAEPGGTVLTGDRADLQALAEQANDVAVEVV